MNAEVSRATSMKLVLRDGVEVYESEDGHSARREEGLTPKFQNPIGGRWVLRNASGEFLDVDQYRHDLFGRNGFAT